MDQDTLLFFDKCPKALPLYEELERQILSRSGNIRITVHKTQITFACGCGFAYAWLPFRKMKGRPEVYIVVSFVLCSRAADPRIIEAAEPYPGRWTHHVIVQSIAEIDSQLLDWIAEARTFAEARASRRKKCLVK